jgi:D-alanyl-D-alanine carboxypeptidase
MYKKVLKFLCITLIFTSIYSLCYAKSSTPDEEITQLLNQYLKDHESDELITGLTASISLPKLGIKNYSAGKVSKDKNANSMLPTTFFQIGSITKSYTAAIILQLEAQGKLNINQSLGQWLAQYPKWKNVTIKQLLNMTSGIPDYVSVPKLTEKMMQNIKRQWTDSEIVDIAYSYPEKTTGYSYSNTNYLILSMIIEKATHHSFTEEINSRLIEKNKLNHTYYYVKPYPQNLLDIQARGYYYGKTIGSIKYGQDVTDTNMSLAGAAGAILATSDDIVRWVDLLFSGKIIAAPQQKELTEMVSMKTGQPIKTTSADDKFGFGLGVVQGYSSDIGKYWFYEGDTIGHRAIYLWSPCNNIILAIAFNSSAFVDETVKDHSGELLMALYKAVVASNKNYACISR